MSHVTARPLRAHGGKRSWLAALTTYRFPRSKVAAFRTVRATLVIPGIFAVTSHVIDNPQMSLFATFGGFATLVLASFAGSRWQKLGAHVALGVVGSAFIALATVTSSSAAAASLVALPVVFGVVYAGVTGWNAANGAAAALLTYILPAASTGTVGMIPSRLAGWWLATAAGTIAVLVLSPRPGPSPLRRAAGEASGSLGAELISALNGEVDPERAARVDATGRALAVAFTAAPYRPTGLAVADQAVAHLVESLRWCASLISDLFVAHVDLSPASPAVTQVDRQRLESAAALLRHLSRTLAGSPPGQLPPEPRSVPGTRPDGPNAAVDRPGIEEGGDLGSQDGGGEVSGDRGSGEGNEEADVAFHARLLTEGVRGAAADVAVAIRASAEPPLSDGTSGVPGWAGDRGGVARARASAGLSDLRGQMSLRSVWVRNAARAAVAIAAAIAIADVTNLQHGFWVVLGTLAVLRTSAAATGVNAWWALLGTVAGVLIGSGVVLGIGIGSGALWAAFVVAVLVAAYAPGVLPFPAGQAAFTVMLLVLFNLIAPDGWKVGVYRVEDIGIGVAVSAVVGLLFWPRGAVAAVADDLADAVHRAGIYLVQATAWALGTRAAPPDATRVQRASERLDDATRSLLAEQSAKRTPKEEVWNLVGGAMKLRLTAASLAAAEPPRRAVGESARYRLLQESLEVAGQCDELAALLGHTEETVVRELAGVMPTSGRHEPSPAPRLVWVRQHIEHARSVVLSMSEPASDVARVRRTPWWR